MIIDELITELNKFSGVSKPLFAAIEAISEKRQFVYVFGNSKGFPAIHILDEEPLPENKHSQALLKELLIWKCEDHRPESPVYLVTIYEYSDESYDFRYFKLQAICDKSDHFLLIGDQSESVELRTHFDAFDESMLDEEE